MVGRGLRLRASPSCSGVTSLFESFRAGIPACCRWPTGCPALTSCPEITASRRTRPAGSNQQADHRQHRHVPHRLGRRRRQGLRRPRQGSLHRRRDRLVVPLDARGVARPGRAGRVSLCTVRLCSSVLRRLHLVRIGGPGRCTYVSGAVLRVDSAGLNPARRL